MIMNSSYTRRIQQQFQTYMMFFNEDLKSLNTIITNSPLIKLWSIHKNPPISPLATNIVATSYFIQHKITIPTFLLQIQKKLVNEGGLNNDFFYSIVFYDITH